MLDISASRKLRYLLVGGLNTLFGYMVGVGVYNALTPDANIWTIGIVSNILSITFSFFTYKIFVFKTKGQWLREYLKCYLVYGTIALANIALLGLYVNGFGMSIWVSQALLIFSTTVFSYLGHARITFSK